MKRGQLVKLLLDEEAHCFLANNEFYIIVVTDSDNVFNIAYNWCCDNCYSTSGSLREVKFGYCNCESYEGCEDIKAEVNDVIDKCKIFIDEDGCKIDLER